MTEILNREDQLDLSYARIIACDKANGIMELYREGKRSSGYGNRIFDHLDQNEGKGTFFLSSGIDRYVQKDETKAEKQNDGSYHLLYLDELPLCLIRVETSQDPDQKWTYHDYPLSDEKCFDLIGSGQFCVLNACNFGLYLIAENGYYALSPSPFEEEDFFDQVKKLDIVPDKEIGKCELDLDLIRNINVSIRDYDYDLSEEDLSYIKKYMKENEEASEGCFLIGPIPQYQYDFVSLNDIEVRDIGRENGCLSFKLVKENEVMGYVHYDPFDEGSDSQIAQEINEADKEEKDIRKYCVSLSPLGHIFEDRIIEEETDDPDRSQIDRMVAEEIQKKIREEGRSFDVYQLDQ